MTIHDYEAIKQLQARYCHTIDFADQDGFLTCFAEDASFVGPGANQQGEEQLRGFVIDVAARSLGHVRHCVVSSLIDGDGTTARAVTYAVMTRDFGPPVGKGQPTHSAVLSSGVYSDTLCKIEGAWVFSSRTFRFDGTPDARALLGTPLSIDPVDATGDASGMSALDREAIRQLLTRYCYTLDFHDHDGFVECFTPDGSLEADVQGSYTGREKLREFTVAMAEAGQGHSRHASLSVRIDGDGKHARVWSYCLNPMDYFSGYVPVGDRFAERMNPTIGHTGVYRDEVVKVDGRWLIAKREFGYDGSPRVADLIAA